jgi:hypothetical protein
MKAAVSEFALSALSLVAAMVFAVSGQPEIGGAICIGAVGLGYLGHRSGLAKIASKERLASSQSQERLATARFEERLAAARQPSPEVDHVAAEVRASSPAASHWSVKRGEVRRSSEPPVGVDPFEYLVFRHTRSSLDPPVDPALPPLRHFLDLREAALIEKDRDLMVDLLATHIQKVFPGHDAYTGVLIPRTGNVALGLGVANRLGLEPVLVRDRPLFGRSTESVLTAGLLILVDDIWSDGRDLRRAVELARFDNFSIADGVLLVARSEGAVVADLAASNVLLQPLFVFDDERIDSIIGRVGVQMKRAEHPLSGIPEKKGLPDET